ncbi:MAG: trypsin-like peptidase domain-containing protein [Planctomycetaceae bacterium]
MATQRHTVRRRLTALLAAIVFALSAGGVQQSFAQQASVPATTPELKKISMEDIVERLKYSTCHIELPGIGSGTGWILDVEQRLVITNHHVIEGAKTVNVYFPVKRKGAWVNELRYYRTFVPPSKATVIASTKKRDLALLQLDALPKGVRPLTLAPKSPRQGSQLHSLGGKPRGSSAMWIYTVGHVRQITRRPMYPGQPPTRAVEAQMEYNKGNSGGPIVDDYGRLVAVVESFQTNARNVSNAVDVTSVRIFVKNTKPLVSPTTAEHYYERGRRHLDVGRTAEAVRDLSAAILKDPRLAKAYAKRGWAFLKRGDARTAIGDFDHAVKLDATLADAYHGKGQCRMSQKRYSDAVAEFSNAIRFNPTRADHYNERGRASLYVNDVKSAHSDFTQACELDGDQPVFFGNRGLAARLLGRYRDGVKAYTRAVALSGHHMFHNGLGLCYLGLGEYKAAQMPFVRAITNYKTLKKKDNWEYFRNFGIALHKNREFQSAYNVFSKAIGMNPKDAGLYYHLSLAAREIGKTDIAKGALRKAAQLDPKKYGSLAGGSKGKTGAPVSRTATATGKPAGASKLIGGAWIWKGKIKGVPVVIGVAFDAQGGYASRMVFLNESKKQESKTYTGTYSVKGSMMTIRYKDGKTVNRRFGFAKGKLWMNLTDTLMLYFDRKS